MFVVDSFISIYGSFSGVYVGHHRCEGKGGGLQTPPLDPPLTLGREQCLAQNFMDSNFYAILFICITIFKNQ